MTDTVARVSRPRGELTALEKRTLERSREQRDAADSNYRRLVVEALLRGASFMEVSKHTGLSTATLQKWKREAT